MSLKYFSSIPLKNNKLGAYLAGLIEGDGSIIVPETVRNDKGKLQYPRIKITFVNKDEPLANKLMEVLGAGTIEWSPNKMYFNLLIQDTKTLYLVANLINGYMRTPKIEALHRLIDWLNNRPDSPEITKRRNLRFGAPNFSWAFGP